MKEFNVFEEKDFDKMVIQFKLYFYKQKQAGKKFQKLKIISKRYVKSRTPKQLKTYWVCIHEMKKAFFEAGNIFDEMEIHSFVKRESGFTKMVELANGKQIMIEKSISDHSEDVNIENINFLINFMIEWTQINLNYEINLDGSL